MEPKEQGKCQEKMSFDSEQQARVAAIVAQHQRGIRLRPYKCQQCGLWHNATDYRPH